MDEYYEILDMIEAKRIDITKLYLLSCLEGNGKEKEIQMMNYCYNLWLNADVDIELSRLADIVRDNWSRIQQDEMLDTDIIEMCLDY